MILRISQRILQRTQNNVLKAHRRGKLVESRGLALQRCNHSSAMQEDSSLITSYGLGIKYNADKSFQYLRLLKSQGKNSRKLYCQSIQAYTNAVRTHIEAMDLYLSIIKRQQGTGNS
jgi:hypothetical protein